MSIKKPSAVESPYVVSSTSPTVLNLAPGVQTAAQAAASQALIDANVATANRSYYANGQAAIDSLVTTSRTGVFSGANVTLAVTEQNYITQNKTFTGSNIGNSISVTGNITSGGYFIGNGSQLANISSRGNFIVNGGTKVDIVAPGGNVIIRANITQWLFSTNGNTSLPGNLSLPGNIDAGNVLVSNITTTHNIYGTTGSFTGDEYGDGAVYAGHYAGTVLGSDVVMQVTANAGGYSQTNFQNINPGPGASSDYILTADNGNDVTHFLDMGMTSSGWDGSETNVLSNLVPNNGYLYVQDGNLTLGTRAGNVSYGWNFDTNGGTIFPTLTTPDGGQPTGNFTAPTMRIGDGLNDGIISTPDGTLTNSYTNLILQPGQGYDDSRGGKTLIFGGRGGPTAGSGGGDVRIHGGYAAGGGSGGDIELYLGNSTDANNTGTVRIVSTSGDSLWTFNNSGNVIFPTLTVDLHNGGNQSGQTLQFGDPNQQAFITGPAPAANVNAQRLIIQGQRGFGTGEGGDVYVWGGDSEINGGDIKIYAGDADSGGSGRGGNIHISGGTGQNPGGEISLTGGQTYNGQGAPVVVTGGGGSTTGGNVNLRGGGGDITGGPISIVAGYGLTTGGNVDITGGQSGAGLPGYGNVNINAGASSWHFDNTGNLTIPGNILGSGNILIVPDSASSSAYLDIYLTGGPDIHIASNDNSIVIGRDTGANIFVGNDGEVSIRTDNGATAQVWQFDNVGNLTLPGNTSSINYANGQPYGGSGTANTGNVTFSDQIVIGTGISNLVSGLYLAPSSSSANAVQYLRVRGDTTYEPTHIHFDTGNNQYFNQFIGDDNKYVLLSNTGNIVINTDDYAGNTAQWTFGTDGNLTVPGNIVHGNVRLSLHENNSNTAYLTSTTDDTTALYMDTTSAQLYSSSILVTGTGNNGVYIGTSNTRIVQDSADSSQVGNIELRTSLNNQNYAWVFDSTGNLKTPGSGGDITGANVVSAVTFSATGVVKTGVFVTGNIIGAATVGAGARAFVTDADIRTWGNLYVGGAGNAVPVWSNGTNWYIG